MHRFFVLNAFADQAHNAAGNPAAICVVDEFPPDEYMAESARRIGTPMTSFVRCTDDPWTFEIRHFTPGGVEDRICGHATLAASALLAIVYPHVKDREVTMKLNPRFNINAANAFKIRIGDEQITMTLPAMDNLEAVEDPEFYSTVADILGIDENDIVRPAYFSPLIENYLIELKDEQALLAMKPDFARLRQFGLTSEKFPNEGIMATALASRPGFDLVGRVFQPVLDVNEDAACGSANCLVLPYWTLKRPEALPPGKTTFRALFPVNPYGPGAGGAQTLSIDLQEKTIQLGGKAVYMREVFPWPKPAPAPAPKPPGF